MSAYVVYQPQSGDAEARAANTRFVRDAFSWLALVFPLLWLAFHRLWFAVALVLVASVGVFLLGGIPGLAWTIVPLDLLIGLYVAVEGAAWRMAAAERSGLSAVGVVEATSLQDAELRFFHGRAVSAARGTDGIGAVKPRPLQPVLPRPAAFSGDPLLFGKH